MKKLLRLIVVFTLLFGEMSVYHVHDDKCGYNPETKTGCRYEIDLNQDKDTGI